MTDNLDEKAAISNPNSATNKRSQHTIQQSLSSLKSAAMKKRAFWLLKCA